MRGKEKGSRHNEKHCGYWRWGIIAVCMNWEGVGSFAVKEKGGKVCIFGVFTRNDSNFKLKS